MKKKMGITAGIAFLVTLITIDSPVCWLAVISTAVMAIAVFKGQLWDYPESESKNDKV